MQTPNLPSSNVALAPVSQPPPFLLRKRKRSVYSFIISSHKGDRCSICLEYDKYSVSKCIKCKKCNSSCHVECYERECTVISDKNDFVCNKCSCKCNETYPKCFLCSDDFGIVVQVKQTNQWSHSYCKRFYKEIVDHEASLANSPDTPISSTTSTHNISIRKWRYKNTCKICHCKSANIPVIKCCNSKCNNYYHISCAIQHGVIFNLSFQDDFYGYSSNALSKRIVYPFYCNYHNKILIHEYEAYVSQMDSLLTPPTKEQDDVINSPTKTTENDDNDENARDNCGEPSTPRDNFIQIQTHMESPVPTKVPQKDNKGSSNANNKENKGLKVYFEYENKNTQFNYNDISSVNVNINDEFDLFKGLEQYPLVFGNNNEQAVMYCGYGLDFFS